ncbi:hypothetical protein AA0111_g11089 [Alternaria arborescens]|uniref:hypothetical protein n=1 Tax=Alternaria arborescens TaxID=156630 RepID=UPI0010751511|nr:hypothetical protein AA0111_g11089 [Alternaria arborescens]RYO17536.1 hypothetical protein AA0111_g11089 [Alternaria arborescens]
MASPSPALPTSRTFITQLFDSLSTLPSDQAADATNDNAKTNTNPLNNLSDTTRKQLLSFQVVFPTEFVPALDLLDRRLVTRFHIRNEEQVAELKTVIDAGGQQQDVQMMQDTTVESEAPTQQQQQQQQQQQENSHTRTTPTPTKEADPTDKDKTNHLNNNDTIYYVRSAQQQRSSRFATSYDTTTYYQVRLRAWNCSCPAFAFSAFPPTPVTTRHVGNEEATVHTPLHNNNNSTIQQEVNNNKDSNNNNADNKWIFGGISLVGKETTQPPPVCKHLLACVFVERCKGLFGGFVEDREVGVEEAAGWAAGWGD